MKQILYILGVATLLLLAGCGDINEKNDREVSSVSDKGVDEVSEEDAEEEENGVEETEQKEEVKSVGTRSNPLPFGDTITVKENIYDDSFNAYPSTLELTMLEVIRGEEAWTIIETENPYNELAEDGYEYALVKVKGFLKDSETDDDSLFFSSFNFNFVSDEGEVYEFVSAVIPNELQKELFSGGTGEGYIYNQVKVDDDFKVSYDSSEGSPVFFLVK